jgi:hypothetical protein
MEPKPVPDWLIEALCAVGGVAVLMALLSTMELWPRFHILGD